jgi:hypothetical protein
MSTRKNFSMSNDMFSSKRTAPSSPGDENKRFSLNASADIADLVEYLSTSQSVTANEAIRRAIVTEAYLLKERENGGVLLIQKPDKEVREIVFR